MYIYLYICPTSHTHTEQHSLGCNWANTHMQAGMHTCTRERTHANTHAHTHTHTYTYTEVQTEMDRDYSPEAK